MGDPDHPGHEFPIVLVFSFLEGFDNLNKGILENVLCQRLILDNEYNIGKNLVFVPINQDLNTGLIALDKPFYQILI
jgi:hypothetical protein